MNDHGIEWVDAVDSSGEDYVAALLEVQNEFYGEYEYVPAVLRDWARGPMVRGDIVHRQQLGYINGELAAFIIFDTNLKRLVTIGHFMAVLPEFRGRGLAMVLELHARDTGILDAAAQGVDLIAYVGECERHMLPLFEKWGFAHLPVDYAEPYHGNTWPQYGEPQFFDRALIALPLPDVPLDIPRVASAGAAAFLLDHYQLPPDHPVVTRCVGVSDDA